MRNRQIVVECLGSRHGLVTGAHREDESSRSTHGLNANQIVSDQVRHGASDQGDQNGVEVRNSTVRDRVGRSSSERRDPPVSKEEDSFMNFSWFSSRTAVTALSMGVLDRLKTFIFEKGLPLFLQLFGLEHCGLPKVSVCLLCNQIIC